MDQAPNLPVKRGVVQLPDDVADRTAIVDELRRGTYSGTVAGHHVVGFVGIADMIQVRPTSLHMARSRRLRQGRPRRPRDLPEPLYQLEHRGAIVYLFDLAAIRTWAAQTGRVPLAAPG